MKESARDKKKCKPSPKIALCNCLFSRYAVVVITVQYTIQGDIFFEIPTSVAQLAIQNMRHFVCFCTRSHKHFSFNGPAKSISKKKHSEKHTIFLV